MTVWGWTDDPTITPDVVRYAASVLRRLGYRTRVHLVPRNAVDAPLETIQMIPGAWGNDTPDGRFITWFARDGPNVHGWFCDPRIDRWVRRAQALNPTNPRRRHLGADRPPARRPRRVGPDHRVPPLLGPDRRPAVAGRSLTHAAHWRPRHGPAPMDAPRGCCFHRRREHLCDPTVQACPGRGAGVRQRTIASRVAPASIYEQQQPGSVSCYVTGQRRSPRGPASAAFIVTATARGSGRSSDQRYYREPLVLSCRLVATSGCM